MNATTEAPAAPRPITDQETLTALRTKVQELRNRVQTYTNDTQDLKRLERMLAIAEGAPRKKRRTKEEIIAAGGTVKSKKAAKN